MGKIELPIEEIVEKYESGMSQEKIARHYYVKLSAVYNGLRKYYEETGKERPKRKPLKLKELPIEELIEKYESGMSQEKLAEEYGVYPLIVRNKIHKYYEETGKERPKRKPTNLIELPMEEIVKKYESGIIQEKLAQEYGVSTTTIYTKIQKYYEKIGKEIPKKVKNLPIEEIIEKYESGKSIEKLAEEYDVNRTTISTRLDNYYKQQKRRRPKILKSESILIEYLKKGLSIGEIREIAQKRNVIIPDDLVIKVIITLESQRNEHELN